MNEHKSPTPSKWKEEAEFRMRNKSWLRYSQIVAVRMLERMDELGMTQQELAELLNCKQQYVAKLLKGRENLSLETIAKIEDALDLHLLFDIETVVA
ncbi:MAG: helix-turn-helix transcriptional regulator [Bacteroidales bacterium]|nr:helix-turn-helix transcriptional regulator [Bacteroidales bacterium]